MVLEITPINRTLLADSVIRQLRDQILSGRLSEGYRLPSERELTQMFGVGRTSIREALKALEAMGLVRRDRSGTTVMLPRPSLGDQSGWEAIVKRATLHELFETRVMFEVRLAELAAERATEEDIMEMEALLAEKWADVEDFAKNDVAFHTALAEATQNQVLCELYVASREILFVSHRLYRAYQKGRVQQVAEILQQATAAHQLILESVKSQNSRSAGQAMLAHLTRLEEMLTDLV